MGEKTHGKWIDPDTGTVHTAVSGKDADAARVEEYLRADGCTRVPTAAQHVEMKLAVMMRDRGISRLDVVINNVPCAGKYGCDGMVQRILAEGESLTVHGTRRDGSYYRKTLTGGERPWWR